MDTTATEKADTESAVDTFAENAKSSVKNGLDQAQDTIERASSQAQIELRKAGDQATTFVKDNPGIALAGALGVGVLVGLALRQRY